MDAKRDVLIVYYSLTGNTARVARDLASRLDADLESLKDPRHGDGLWGQVQAGYDAWRNRTVQLGPLQRDPSEYALTIVGTPIWAWRMAPAVRTYLQQMRGRFVSFAYFCTSGDTEAARVRSAFESTAGVQAIALAGFNHFELTDASIYERKLSNFVRELENAPTGAPRFETATFAH